MVDDGLEEGEEGEGGDEEPGSSTTMKMESLHLQAVLQVEGLQVSSNLQVEGLQVSSNLQVEGLQVSSTSEGESDPHNHLTCICIMALSTRRKLPFSSLVLRHSATTCTPQNLGCDSRHCKTRWRWLLKVQQFYQ